MVNPFKLLKGLKNMPLTDLLAMAKEEFGVNANFQPVEQTKAPAMLDSIRKHVSNEGAETFVIRVGLSDGRVVRGVAVLESR